MGKALYRRYRSTSLDEVIGQNHITTTLKNSLNNNTISHAYLLTGPRGVGKTSVARILAFAVNNLPYEHDSTHLDIIEIDAASNRRIDEIRDLREKIHIAPTSAKYKVYIIDEVHMLTREAFNALLKTLEEPPQHVIFILATTEFYKLPETIVSRCVRFTFHPIDAPKIVEHLQHIAIKESLDISEAALGLIAKHGDGSFRDSISLLDQVKSIGNKIELSDVEQMLGLASKETVNNILDCISNGNAKELDHQLNKAFLHGASETALAKQIAENLRTSIINNHPQFGSTDTLKLLEELLSVPSSPKPKAKLELALLDILFKQQPIEKTTIGIAPVEKSDSEAVLVQEKKSQAQKTIPEHTAVNKADFWLDVLKKLKTQHNTLYSIVRMAKAEHFDDSLTLTFRFPFHFKKMNDTKNKQLLATAIKEMCNKDVVVNVILSDEDEYPVFTPSEQSEEHDLSTINNIFGSSEMLES